MTTFYQIQGRIQFRRGTLAEWTTTNPVLWEGEMVLEIDTDKFKVGDGVTPYVDLPYGGIQGADGISEEALASTSGASKVGLPQGSTLDQYLRNSLGKVVTNIDQVRALSKVLNTQVRTLGYYSLGDGGAGTYFLDASDATSVDNGGTCIVATDGGRWKLVFDKFVSAMQFGAKGDGIHDDTAFINKAIDSVLHVYFPDDRVFKLTSQLTVNNPRRKLSGSGELRFLAGVAGDVGIQINAPNFEADGLRITNPNGLKLAYPGYKTAAMLIRGHYAYVHGCSIDNWENGIWIGADGEWQCFRLHNNLITNVDGSGGGPNDLTHDWGEDRGDAIAVWGSIGSIMGNVCTAKPGTDSRCGIFVEGLQNFAGNIPADVDALVTVTGNTVSGPFRRSIDVEAVMGCVVSSNTCSSGNWGAIQVSDNTNRCVIVGNFIRFSRAENDNTGAIYSPWRCGINLYAKANDCLIANNVIEMIGFGIGIKLGGIPGGRMQRPNITGNTISYPNGANGVAIHISYCDLPNVTNNVIQNSKEHGIYGYDARNGNYVGNMIMCSLATPSYGLWLESGFGSNVVANTITATTAISAFNAPQVSFQSNRLVGCTSAGDFYGCTNSNASNNMLGGATAFGNFTNGQAGNVSVGNV